MSQPTAAVNDPKPAGSGLMRTIGILNLLFGGFLLICGAGCLNAVVPFLARNHPLRLDRVYAEEVVDLMRQQMVDDLLARERSAADPAEKGRIGKVRLGLESAPKRLDAQVDFRKVNADLPWLARYLWLDVVTGPVLNLLLVVSGVGLLRSKPWGRRMAVGVAAMKVVRLIGLSALLAFGVVPHMRRTAAEFAHSEIGGALLRGAMDPSAAGQTAVGLPAARLDPGEFVQVLSAFGYTYAALNLALGAIYPVVALIVLHRAGSRPTATA